MMMDLPPYLHERVTCSISAAVQYGIPANIMLAVAEKEGGKAGQWVRNANGSHDVGPLQFNTGYLSQLYRYGITAADVAAAGCYPYRLAAWRLRQHIKHDGGDLWTRCANYHSRTPRFNGRYRADLIRQSVKWADWLGSRYMSAGLVSDVWPASKRLVCNSLACAHFAMPQFPAQAVMKPSYAPRTLVHPPKP